MNIIPIIRELLLRNQKTVIPGFGAFIIAQRPAQLNKVSRVLTPPIKEIIFDSNQQTDDKQLAGYMTRKLKQKSEAVNEIIRQFKQASEEQLKQKGSLTLESLGVLSLEKSSRYSFKADEDLLKQVNLFGPPKLNIQVAEPEAVNKAVQPSRQSRPVVTHRRKRRWWIPAAILLLLAALGTMSYYNGLFDNLLKGKITGVSEAGEKKDSEKLIFGTIDPDSGKTGVDTSIERISREIDARTAREKALSYQATESGKPVKKEIPPEPARQVSTSVDKPYQIIAGSFLVPNNAERQMNTLRKKGYSPVLLPKWGDYFMVSLGSYDTHEQATSAVKQLRSNLDQELWVMKR